MATMRDHDGSFAPLKQLPHWSQLDRRDSGAHSNAIRPPLAHHEPLRPIEPGESQSNRYHYPNSRFREESHIPHRQQLPGVHELLSPLVRTGARSPVSGTWAPINNAPPSWKDRVSSTVRGSSHSIPHAPPTTASVHPSPYRHSMDPLNSQNHRHNSIQPSLGIAVQRPPSMPMLPTRQLELPSLGSHVSPEYPQRGEDYLASHFQTISAISNHDTLAEQMMNRRSSSTLLGKPNGALNLQIVGQRDIPGEGLCYVFKDGSTCPTIIDGEPVNPLWGTTKAGKARKRLAQACLNCREKKIKCEPGETSCLQCEKAKRECLRPLAQSQAEMATGAALSMSNRSPERGDWNSQPSPESMSTSDLPAPKRRRSAHIAQQESTFSGSVISITSSPNEFKRCRSDDIPSQPNDDMQRLRKDSKRPLADEDERESATTLAGKLDMTAQCEDPYQVEPDGTMLFLDLFFVQSAREIRMLFPRKTFTRWVRSCRSKCQRECMVLYAVLAIGSIAGKNEFSSFGRICIERATQAAANFYGSFSVALIQARLLLGSYHRLNGKDNLASDYNGSALRAVGAMRLNLEEGCADGVEESSARRYCNFTTEQLRECKRRTFWVAFLMDRYNGFCSGLMNMIHEDDVHIRFPCVEQTYEDGDASTTPLFGTVNIDPSHDSHPAAFTITASSLWKEVTQFIHRSEFYPPSIYASRYESFLRSIQEKLSDWTQRLPRRLKYSRENLEQAMARDYAGDFVSMHTLHLFSHMKIARMIRHELITAQVVARSICTAHSHALQLLALVRDVRILTLGKLSTNQRTTDVISPFIAYAITSAIDTVGAGGLREEIVATIQVMSTATEVMLELSQQCSSASIQAGMAEKRLAHVESVPPELDIRAGKATDSRCWRIVEPMEKMMSLKQDVMYGVSPLTFAEALAEGRKR